MSGYGYGYGHGYYHNLRHDVVERMPSGVFFDSADLEPDGLPDLSQFEKGVDPLYYPAPADDINHGPLQRFKNAQVANCFYVAHDSVGNGGGSFGLYGGSPRGPGQWSQTTPSAPPASVQRNTRQCLPILNVDAAVHVESTIAKTVVTQTFTNISSLIIKEANYSFPLYDGAAVVEFRCYIGDTRVLEGVVKPKDVAKAEFKEAVAKRKVAALLEEHTPEVFETSLGNIPAKTRVKIEIVYISELKADIGGEGVLLTIPTSIAPRYGTPPAGLSGMSSFDGNGLHITVDVSAQVPIRMLESRTHPIRVEMGIGGSTAEVANSFADLASDTLPDASDSMKKARAALSERTTVLGQDFAMLILTSGTTMLASCALLEPAATPEGHAAMMLRLNPRTLFSRYMEPENFEGEIIFIADRSGSMMGPRIDALKEALQVFLRSIPSDKVYFNVYSFGSGFSSLWPTSQMYDQARLEQASHHVAGFTANMGGTEILRPLREAVKRRLNNIGLSTQIIILTDGEVWDEESIIQFVRESRAELKDGIRFFALGIGNEVSHRLVEGIGQQGGGFTEVVGVDSRGRWDDRVIRMLKAAMMPPSFECTMEINNIATTAMCSETKDSVFMQAPYQIPALHPFTCSSIFFLMDHKVQSCIQNISVKSKTPSGEPMEVKLRVQHVPNRSFTIHYLAAKALVQELESGTSWLHSTTTAAKDSTKLDARALGEKLGIEYHITSKWTSFIATERTVSTELQSRLYRAPQDEHAFLVRQRTAPIGPSRYNALTARPALPQLLGMATTDHTPSSTLVPHMSSIKSSPSTPHRNSKQKMSLEDFWTDQTLGSWADEMEEVPTSSPYLGSAASSGLGYQASAPRNLGTRAGSSRKGSAAQKNHWVAGSSRPHNVRGIREVDERTPTMSSHNSLLSNFGPSDSAEIAMKDDPNEINTWQPTSSAVEGDDWSNVHSWPQSTTSSIIQGPTGSNMPLGDDQGFADMDTDGYNMTFAAETPDTHDLENFDFDSFLRDTDHNAHDHPTRLEGDTLGSTDDERTGPNTRPLSTKVANEPQTHFSLPAARPSKPKLADLPLEAMTSNSQAGSVPDSPGDNMDPHAHEQLRRIPPGDISMATGRISKPSTEDNPTPVIRKYLGSILSLGRSRGRRGPLSGATRMATAKVRSFPPCSNCRLRKTKCDEGVPCGACIRNKDRLDDQTCRGQPIEETADLPLRAMDTTDSSMSIDGLDGFIQQQSLDAPLQHADSTKGGWVRSSDVNDMLRHDVTQGDHLEYCGERHAPSQAGQHLSALISLHALIATQAAIGYFRPTTPQLSAIATEMDTTMLQHDLRTLASIAPLSPCDSQTLYDTLVIANYIKRKFPNDNELWELVIAKAERWIKSMLKNNVGDLSLLWVFVSKAWDAKHADA